MSEFKDQLLSSAGVKPERIMEFSCGELVDLGPHCSKNTITISFLYGVGHVIPPSHLLPLCLCKGPAGESFEFTFQNRDRGSMVSCI